MTTIDTASPGDIWMLVKRGEAVVVDLRSPAAFARGHLAGAISVLFSERDLAERVAIALPDARPVALVASHSFEAELARRQLTTGGRACLGALPADDAAWQEAGIPWEVLPEVPVTSLAGGTAGNDRVVLDVREPMEWETGYVPGATLIPLGRVRDELDRLPRDREIAVICEAGVRSATAASVLRAAGFPRVANVPEGTATYRAAGWPLAYPPAEESEGR
ncbi:MAG: rhodanese-like domain-containing protein [Thermomicrobiales bacterium]